MTEHFGVKSAVRIHRINQYGSFAVLDFPSKLLSPSEPVISRGKE